MLHTADRPSTKAPTAKAAGGVAGTDVLVAIPVLNEEKHLEACVRSLMAADERLKSALVVIADGGSKDKTRDIAAKLAIEFPNIRIIDNPKKLQAAAVNRVAETFGEGRRVLVRCDAHATYAPNFIMAVADSLVAKGVELLATPMDAEGVTCFQRAVAFTLHTPLGSGGSIQRGGTKSGYIDHGHHSGFDLKTFLKLGGYNETFSHNEDGEYDVRLAKEGGRIWFDADIRLIYRPRATARALAKQYFSYGKGRARNLRLHNAKPRLRQMAPPVVVTACIAGLLLAPLSPWTLLVPAGYVGMLALASLYGAVRMGSLCGLGVGPAAGVIHFAWSAGFLRQRFAKP
jgi:succinoglycan biosynthesis protein ExoA